MFRFALVLLIGLTMAGCQLETRAVLKASQVRATATGAGESPLVVDVAVQYANANFCGDYRDRTIEVLRKQFAQARYIECKRVSGKSFGIYQVPTQLVKSPADGSAAAQVLGDKMAAFGVYDDPREGGGYVVGGIIRHWKFQDLKKALEKLYKLPEQSLRFELLLQNDTGTPLAVDVERVKVNRVAVDAKKSITLQPGTSIGIEFSSDKLNTIRRRGWELLFTQQK
jgi:hypothetical protein